MRSRILVALFLLTVAILAGFVTRAGARDEVRDIQLVGRNMTFYLAGQSDANPTLHVRPGERVRITLRNETPGIVHDLAVDAVGVAMSPLKTGETGVLDFRAPDQPGRYDYHCRPHALMMRGVLDVVAE
jgi:plastocyanin